MVCSTIDMRVIVAGLWHLSWNTGEGRYKGSKQWNPLKMFALSKALLPGECELRCKVKAKQPTISRSRTVENRAVENAARGLDMALTGMPTRLSMDRPRARTLGSIFRQMHWRQGCEAHKYWRACYA